MTVKELIERLKEFPEDMTVSEREDIQKMINKQGELIVKARKYMREAQTLASKAYSINKEIELFLALNVCKEVNEL